MDTAPQQIRLTPTDEIPEFETVLTLTPTEQQPDFGDQPQAQESATPIVPSPHELLERAIDLDAQHGSPEGLLAAAQKAGSDIPTTISALRDHIERETGWYKGPDGQWKYAQ